ncbi:MAG: hypothetical protein PHO91_04255 [Patescibacteria group bacterium]|nr:hypothetical protein [Patescibacteria group bacterium]
MGKKNKIKIKTKSLIYLLVPLFLSVAFLFLPIAQAATLYTTPTSGSYNIGQNFSVVIYVSSPDKAINAVSGALRFPSDKLEVVSLSKNNSAVSLWVQEPSFSNSQGTINFEGIVLNPGYTGSAGRVLTVSFRTKANGSAPLTFSSGSVLANDGQGTNVLTGLGSASFAIEVPVTGPAAQNAESPTVTAGTLPAPQIKSDTHPDSDAWYNNNRPEFFWDLPAGASSLRLLVSDKPQDSPSVVYTPAITSRQLDPLDDGIWYLHIQLRNNAGWGGVGHLRFQIDTANPEYFTVRQEIDEDITSPIRRFYFDAYDSASGISHYEIQIGNSSLQAWEDDGLHVYQTPILSPGRHTAIFKAFDKAGNYLTQIAEFIVEPLEAPLISNYQKFLTTGDPFIIQGQTYPDSQVIFWLQREASDPKSYIINADKEGKFVFLADEKIKEGVYSFWAQAIDQRGARSKLSAKTVVLVEPPSWGRFGNLTLNFLSLAVPVVALIFLLFVFILKLQKRLQKIKSRIRKESGEAHRTFHYGVAYLKEMYQKNANLLSKYLAKEKLTKKEMQELEDLKKELEIAIGIMEKEIEDVEKEAR